MGLLLAKRRLRFVGTPSIMDTVPLSIDTGLQTSSAFVQQGILLSFMFVSHFFLALTFVEPNT